MISNLRVITLILAFAVTAPIAAFANSEEDMRELRDSVQRLQQQLDTQQRRLDAVAETEWATREQVFHSYELLARYVMPHFQGSLVNMKSSQAWSSDKKEELQALRRTALNRARQDYAERR